MTDLTNNVETEVINWLFGGTDTRAASASVYVALHSADPGESPDGSTELTAGSYSRVETAAGTDWTIDVNEASNSAAVEFPQAAEDWGDVTHFSLWDGADSSANPLFSNTILNSNGEPTTKTVTMDDTVSFASDALTATLD